MRVPTLLLACAIPLVACADDAQDKAAHPGAPPVTVLKDPGFGWPVYLCFSPDQKELARISAFGHVLIETSSWEKGRVFDIGIRMVAYSPDGKTLATAEGTDGARIWNVADRGTRLAQPPESLLDIHVLKKPTHVLLTPEQSREQRVFWTTYSPDGSRLLTADANGHVKIWKTGSWTQETDIAPTTVSVRCAIFNPDGKSIAFGDEQGVLHLWDLEGAKVISDTSTPLGAITFLAFSPDGKRLVTAHASNSGHDLMIWNTANWVSQIERGYQSGAFSKDGKILALGGSDIRLLDSVSLQLLRKIVLPELSQREAAARPDANANDKKMPVAVQALAWKPDGRQLAAGCLDGTVRLLQIDK